MRYSATDTQDQEQIQHATHTYICYFFIASIPAAKFSILSSLNGIPKISRPTGSSGSSGYSTSLASPTGTEMAVQSS